MTSTSTADVVRANLAKIMDATGVSQVELANTSGVHFTTINRILRGHMDPTITTIERLAAALHVTPAKLFSEKPEKSAKNS